MGISETLCTLATTVGAFLGDLAAERRYAQEACDHARIAGSDRLLGQALGRLAVVSGDQRGVLLTQASELLIPLGDYRELARACSTAAYVALAEDHLTEATSLLQTALEATASVEDPWTTVLVLSNLGLARLFSNDLDHARDAFERGLRLCSQNGFPPSGDEGLAGLAAVAAAQGRDETAARLRGAAHALGYPPGTFDQQIDDRLERDYLTAARDRLGDDAWLAGEQAGAALSREHATAYALGIYKA